MEGHCKNYSGNLVLSSCTPQKYLVKMSEHRFLEWEDSKQTNMLKAVCGWGKSMKMGMKFFEVDGSFYILFSKIKTTLCPWHLSSTFYHLHCCCRLHADQCKGNKTETHMTSACVRHSLKFFRLSLVFTFGRSCVGFQGMRSVRKYRAFIWSNGKSNVYIITWTTA